MAENDIVRSLFGPTPNEVRQQNIANDNAAAHAYGMMTHQQRGAEGFNRAGAEIARGVAGLAGYVDPAEQRAQQEQAILSRYDTSTTDGMAQASQAAKAMGRYDLVAKIQQYHTGIQKQQDAHETAQANINKATANAEKMRRLQELSTKPGWDTWVKQANLQFPNPEDKAQRDDLIFELSMRGTKNQNRQVVTTFTPDGRQIKTVVDLDTTEKTDIGSAKGDEHKAFDQGAGTSSDGKPLVQHMVWNSVAGVYEAVGEPKQAGGGVNVKVDNITKIPGQNAQFRKSVIETVKPHYEIVTNADLGIAALQESLATGNFIDFNASRGSIAKAMGDTHISAADIKAAGGDPSLVGGFMDYLNKLGTGTPSRDTQQKMLATLQLLKKIASNKANAELSKQAKLGLMDGMSQAQVDAALDFPEFKPGTSKTPIQKVLKSGKTVTVEQD